MKTDETPPAPEDDDASGEAAPVAAPPVPAPAPEPAAHADTTPAPGRAPMHWLLEGLFIVVSVALGFGLTQWGEARHDRELADRMLLGVRGEVERNRATLDPYIPIHRAWRDLLDAQDPATGTGSAMELLFDIRPPLQPGMTTNIPLLRRAAWDTALSTGALRLVDYDLAAGISEIYNMQAYAATAFPELFAQTAFFDPASRAAAVRLTQVTMRELTFAEESLLELYDTHLPAIRAATGEP